LFAELEAKARARQEEEKKKIEEQQEQKRRQQEILGKGNRAKLSFSFGAKK